MANAARERTPRWNADPEDVRRSVLKLVLTLVELIRQLLERQAIRRMEARTLDPDEIERVGLALMRLQETVVDLANEFDIAPEELNLDLGPVGKLLSDREPGRCAPADHADSRGSNPGGHRGSRGLPRIESRGHRGSRGFPRIESGDHRGSRGLPRIESRGSPRITRIAADRIPGVTADHADSRGSNPGVTADHADSRGSNPGGHRGSRGFPRIESRGHRGSRGFPRIESRGPPRITRIPADRIQGATADHADSRGSNPGATADRADCRGSNPRGHRGSRGFPRIESRGSPRITRIAADRIAGLHTTQEPETAPNTPPARSSGRRVTN